MDDINLLYPWLKDMDRAALILGSKGQVDAARLLADEVVLAEWQARHRLWLDETDVLALQALFRV